MESAVGLNVELSRTFNVPVERLYKAWTAEEDLKQWWHPMDNHLKSVVNELKEGGSVAYTFESKEGKEIFTIKGIYKEVVEGKKLIYTWNWQLPTTTVKDSEFLLTVTFDAANEGSSLTVRQEQFADEESVHPHREGWEKALNNLEAYLSNQ